MAMTAVAHKASPSRIRHPGLWVISGAFPSVRRRFPGSLLLGGAASARRATTGAWRRPPYLSSITSSRPCRSAQVCCQSLSACATAWSAHRAATASNIGPPVRGCSMPVMPATCSAEPMAVSFPTYWWASAATACGRPPASPSPCPPRPKPGPRPTPSCAKLTTAYRALAVQACWA